MVRKDGGSLVALHLFESEGVAVGMSELYGIVHDLKLPENVPILIRIRQRFLSMDETKLASTCAGKLAAFRDETVAFPKLRKVKVLGGPRVGGAFRPPRDRNPG